MAAPEHTRRAAARGPRTRLRSVPHGVERNEVADIQRGRILAAMFEMACERGAASVTVGDVVERSGVSRRTFYEVFEDREDCFMAALQEALTRASERIVPAYRAAGGWRERIRACVIELLCLLEEEPFLGRLLVCESLAAGPQALECRNRVLAAVRSAVDEGRLHAHGGTPSPLTAEATVGGVLSVIHSRLLEPGQVSLMELANPLVSMIVLPYLGASAARRELTRPLPASPAGGQGRVCAPSFDPFKDAGIRLTYRTVRVLMAIAEAPDASNRTIGTRAGISDPGQISKLLTRLERAGLVRNSGLGAGQGAPNAWSLTGSGQSVVRGIRANAESPRTVNADAAVSDVVHNKHS